MLNETTIPIVNTGWKSDKQQPQKNQEDIKKQFFPKKIKNNRKRTRGRIRYVQTITYIDGFEIKKGLKWSRVVTKRIMHKLIK